MSQRHWLHFGLELRKSTHFLAREPWHTPSFATSYLCEIGFSAVASIKTKYRSKLDIKMNSEWQSQNCNPYLTRSSA
ncbi:Transposase [Caligus rogercresseyi]|uniref:Transposase n=1 Tax=Caligus rogercresseyi TaxID=217165 RepID=A0A7T8KBS1_CALRO|nr:Transposase [Caligus rogercresseyi]